MTVDPIQLACQKKKLEKMTGWNKQELKFCHFFIHEEIIILPFFRGNRWNSVLQWTFFYLKALNFPLPAATFSRENEKKQVNRF